MYTYSTLSIPALSLIPEPLLHPAAQTSPLSGCLSTSHRCLVERRKPKFTSPLSYIFQSVVDIA